MPLTKIGRLQTIFHDTYGGFLIITFVSGLRSTPYPGLFHQSVESSVFHGHQHRTLWIRRRRYVSKHYRYAQKKLGTKALRQRSGQNFHHSLYRYRHWFFYGFESNSTGLLQAAPGTYPDILPFDGLSSSGITVLLCRTCHLPCLCFNPRKNRLCLFRKYGGFGIRSNHPGSFSSLAWRREIHHPRSPHPTNNYSF